MKRALCAAVLSGLVALPPAAATTPIDAGDSARRPAAEAKLRAFRSCSSLIRYARRHTREAQGDFAGPRTGGPLLPPPTPTPERGAGEGGGFAQPIAAPEDTSGTNVQEAGVDEPDIVKTDGSTIFSVARGRLFAVDARSQSPRLLGSVELTGDAHELLLDGGRLLVIARDHASFPRASQDVAPPSPPPDAGRPAVILSEVDVTDPEGMRVVRRQTVDGDYVSARLSGGSARVVIGSSPLALEPGQESRRRRISGWVPLVAERRAGRTSRRRAVRSCRAVRFPPVFSGLGMITVLTIDMDRGLPAVDSDGVMTGGELVYASPRSLYVATQRPVPAPEGDELPPRTTTAVHRFDIAGAGETTYRASGIVPGFLLNQFSMSEHDGVLRAATTHEPSWWTGGEREQSESFVTTLTERAGVLAETGRVGGIGRGERIYSVRFIGERGFVVTFRQTDPLFTLDLTDPARPRVVGELELLGYSAYLHPAGDGLLIGVGQDATAQGTQLGTQISLFDVSDLANPRRLAQRRLASESSSEAEYDHHAFLWWPATRLAVLPVDEYGRDGTTSSAVGFHVDRSGIAEAGRAGHDGAPVRRSLVVGGRLFTVSDAGVEANDLATLAEQGRVAFP